MASGSKFSALVSSSGNNHTFWFVLTISEFESSLNCGLAVPKDQVGRAFGLGLGRIAMILFKTADSRSFWSQDPRFLQQFESGKVMANSVRLQVHKSTDPTTNR